MRHSPFMLLAAVLGVFWTTCPAISADKTATDRVAGMVSDNAALIAKYPALGKIDAVIRDDCAAKNKGKAATGEFCGCASAVTMGLWRSGIDPKMVPRIVDYLKSPSDDGAKAFLQYQGPELYTPLCAAGTKS